MTVPIAQDPNESFDVVTFDGTATGIVKPRGLIHRDGDWHRSIHVWIAGLDDGGPFLMFQRRSLAKDTWPGKLDATVGGHFKSGETIDETLREVEEEIGVAVERSALVPLGIRVCVNDAEPGIRDRELQSVFLWLDNRDLAGYRPNPAELDSLVRIRLEDALQLMSGRTDSIEGVSRPSQSADLLRVTLKRHDFIEMIDRYFYRIAIAADRALRGEPHLAI